MLTASNAVAKAELDAQNARLASGELQNEREIGDVVDDHFRARFSRLPA